MGGEVGEGKPVAGSDSLFAPRNTDKGDVFSRQVLPQIRKVVFTGRMEKVHRRCMATAPLQRQDSSHTAGMGGVQHDALLLGQLKQVIEHRIMASGDKKRFVRI